MSAVYEHAVTPYAVTLLFGVASWFFLKGGRRVVSAIRAIDSDPRPTELIRGGRQVLLSLGLTLFGAGLLAHEGWLLIFGVVFLGEEMMETTVMSLAHRFGAGARPEPVTPPAWPRR